MIQPVDYFQAQRSLEALMATEALSRQARDNEAATKRNEWSGTKTGTRYVRAVMDASTTEDSLSFTAQVCRFLETVTRNTPGKHHIAAKILADTGIEPRTIAFLATKAIFNFLGLFGRKEPQKRSSLCMRIADYVHDEWRVVVFQNTDTRKALIKKLLSDFDRRSYPREWRKRTIKNYFDAEQVEWQGWELRQKIVIGYALLCMFKDSTGLVEFSTDGTHVFPSDALLESIAKMTPQVTYQYLLYRPMVVPPNPWTHDNLFRGGYLTRKVRPFSLVKGAKKRDVARLLACDLSRVLPAVNAMQETPWRINREMLEALTWAYKEHGGGVGKLPECDEEPLPPIPPGYNEDETITKAHNRACFDVRDRRREDKSKRIAANMVLNIGESYKVYPELYFPHNLDSRGRAYPIPAFLNPQGPDYVKALLEFSRGEASGDTDSVRWIAIATANAYGNDKVSLDDRVAWVYENEALILSIAEDYRSDLRWTHTSEPFQFLRCCLEWRDLKANGADHVSHMVIPVDATNSGLQHYSAMLRDEHGGFFVNLRPGYARQDIYGKVADVVVEELMESGTETAKNILSLGIDRKVTKRQVMVVPYAGKYSSCLAYTREALKDKLKAGQVLPWDKDERDVHNEHVNILSKAIWNAIDETVIKGKEAMLWLGRVAAEFSKVMNKSELPVYDRRMCWKTPDGFEVVHFREDEKMNRIETKFDGRIMLSFYDGTGQLNPKDMALAVAPNFVHSLDANHLRATIMLGLKRGIKDFAMIHDSFGVHAGQMTHFLRECVKPAFVTMYEGDVLASFAEQFKSICNVPALPQKGNLDLQGVLQSEFFFS